jgi:hypothetical protein
MAHDSPNWHHTSFRGYFDEIAQQDSAGQSPNLLKLCLRCSHSSSSSFFTANTSQFFSSHQKSILARPVWDSLVNFIWIIIVKTFVGLAWIQSLGDVNASP